MKHYQTVDPLQKESQVGRGLFGIRLLILHFKFQFSKSIKSSTFHIFLNLTYPLRKNLSFPKHLKITQKFTQNCQIVDNVISIGIWRRLKRDRDIGRKAVLSDVKTAFTLTPALKQGRRKKWGVSCLFVSPPKNWGLFFCSSRVLSRRIFDFKRALSRRLIIKSICWIPRFRMSRVAHWIARWAHNPEVRGSKPRSVTFFV